MAGSARSRLLDRKAKPAATPAAESTATPAAEPTAEPATEPGAEPAAEPGVEPAAGTSTGTAAMVGVDPEPRTSVAEHPPVRPWWRPDVPVELLVLAFLAAVTRLAGIGHPRAIVFDEVYFREYALRYMDGSYYFDLHPPLGKLLLAGWARLVGVSATAESTDPAVALRILPALAGIALILVFYQFLRELTASRKVATLGAALLLLDNAILVESRLILINSMLLLFGMAAITCYLASRRVTGRSHWVLLVSSAVLAGMCISTKWTGLAALGLIGLVWFARTLRDRVTWRTALPQGAIIVLVPALVYVSVFALHFALLPNSGPGDAYMSQSFQSTLRGNPNYNPDAGQSLPEQLIEINKVIPEYEHSLNDSTHPYSSEWLSWPVLQRPIYYWTDGVKTGDTQEYIYMQGNPVLWWGLLVGVAVIALAWMRRPDLFARHGTTFALLAVAWAANFLPFSTIVRPMFLYHYFFSLMFCIAAVSIGLGLIAGWMTDGEKPWQFPSRLSLGLYVGVLAVVLGCFLYFAPISYGWPLTDAGLTDRQWLSTWR